MSRQRIKAIDFKAGKPTRWQAYDTFSFEVGDASKRRMTDEGFMIVPAFISRTGIQDYGARELGIEGTNRTIRLYRPPEEVFKPESYSTFERQTLTNDHPATSDGVTAANYQSVTSGDVHDVAPAGDDINLGANLYVKAGNTIEMIVTYDKNQLSCGYSFRLDMTPGVTPDGQAYDGVMRDIVGNHVAIVWQARGGPGLRVADNKPNQEKRIMRTVTIDGTNVNFEDDNQGAMVEVALKRASDAVTAANAARDTAATGRTVAETALAAATAASATATATHAAQIVELTAKIPTADALKALVVERVSVMADAIKILGDKFTGDGKDVAEIRVAALDAIVASKDEHPAKAMVAKILGGKKPSDLSTEIAKLAFDGVIGVLAAGVTSTGDRRATDAAALAFAPGKTGGGNVSGARVIDYAARGARTTNTGGGGSASA